MLHKDHRNAGWTFRARARRQTTNSEPPHLPEYNEATKRGLLFARTWSYRIIMGSLWAGNYQMYRLMTAYLTPWLVLQYSPTIRDRTSVPEDPPSRRWPALGAGLITSAIIYTYMGRVRTVRELLPRKMELRGLSVAAARSMAKQAQNRVAFWKIFFSSQWGGLVHGFFNPYGFSVHVDDVFPEKIEAFTPAKEAERRFSSLPFASDVQFERPTYGPGSDMDFLQRLPPPNPSIAALVTSDSSLPLQESFAPPEHTDMRSDPLDREPFAPED